MLRRLLERRGYEISEEADGASGLERCRADHPDVVLLDLRMPGDLSGIDVASSLRSDDATKGIPLVIVSASAHDDARILATGLCDEFIEKPVEFERLIATIERLTS